MISYYVTTDFPPAPLGALLFPSGYEHEPCCWQALECDVPRDEFGDTYSCQLGGIDENVQHLYEIVSNTELLGCAQIEAAAEGVLNITR